MRTDQRETFFRLPGEDVGIFENGKCAGTLCASHFKFQPLTLDRFHWMERVVVMVRHPAERLASVYGWLQVDPKHAFRLGYWFRVNGLDNPFDPRMKPGDFLDAVLEHQLDKHWIPYTEWSRRAFEHSKCAVFQIDGPDRAKQWRDLTGLSWPRKRLNASKHKTALELFGPAGIDRIKVVYSEDYVRGGYDL